MKKLILLIALLSSHSFAQDKVSYKVFYDKNLKKNGLKVQVTYNHEAEVNSTDFQYNNSNWGEEDLFNCFLISEEENPNTSFTKDLRSSRITVRHPKSKEITFTYRVKQDYAEPNHGIFFRPRIQNDFFHVLGTNLFAVPYSFARPPFDKEIEVEIEWIGFPKNFKIHNTFASQSIKQHFKTTLWGGLYNSLFVGGNYRIYEFKCHEKPVYLAIKENWYSGFSDEFLLSNLEKAIFSQRDFWKDYGNDYFTVIMTPTISQNDSILNGSSTTGTALRNGFMLHGTNTLFNNKDSYLYLLHHELMHEWIGGKIPDKYDELHKWFKEGFTEYYTYKNRLRIQDITLDEYIDFFNRNIIETYWKNPEKNIPNYKVKEAYWKNRDVSKVPYKRGAIFAFWLDNQILLKSNYTKSLDDLMREILALCTKGHVKFSEELLVELATRYLDEDLAYILQKHIICGEDMDLVNAKWIEGFHFVMTDSHIPKLVSSKDNEEKYILK